MHFFPCYMFYIMIEMCEMLNKITVWQILTIFVTNRFPLCVATPLPEMCEMLNKITGWQILTIFVTNRFPVCGHPLQTTLLTHLDHSQFCPKRGVPQTSIVISCQFVNISKGNNTIDIACIFFLAICFTL